MLSSVDISKKVTAGSLDGWGWRELKALLALCFDGMAGIVRTVGSDGVWPEGLLDAYIAMIPKAAGCYSAWAEATVCVAGGL